MIICQENESNLNEAASRDINIFHRTGRASMTPTEMEAHVDSLKTGFTPSAVGDMYGKGLYGADWATQMQDGENNMNGYGPIILHYMAKSKGYLIFDYRLSKRLYGGEYSLSDQLIAYGAYTRNAMPVFLSVMSEDLEDTLKYPRISADRARWLADFFYRSKPPSRNMNALKYPPVPSIQQAYLSAANTLNNGLFNAKIKSGIIKGLIFSGNHDGNVIVTFPPSFKKLIFVGWCAAKGSQIIKPWDYDNNNTSADGINGQYQDGIAKLLDNSQGKEIASILWDGALTMSTLSPAVKETLKSLAWIKSPLARYKDLNIIASKEKMSILSGFWIAGDCKIDIFEGTFVGGQFLGAKFKGNFQGGTFSKGLFEGVFSGGIYVLSEETSWSRLAELGGTSGSRSIKINNKVYPWKITDSPEKEWEYIQSEQAAKIAGVPGGIKDLPVYLSTKLGYKCDIEIDNDWEKGLSDEQKYLKFKQAFSWLFLVRRWSSAPTIHLSKNQIALVKGELVVGTLMFNYYGKEVVINGGQIAGRNTFEGTFRGGVYNEGKFEGAFMGGVFNLDKAVWVKTAKGVAPKNLDNEYIYAVIYKNKLYKIPKEVLSFEDNGKRIYQNIGEIQKVLSAGKWTELVIAAKKADLNGGGQKRRYRADSDELNLDPSESEVPEWAVDDSGGSAAKVQIPEGYAPTNGSMLNFIYGNYLSEKNRPFEEPVTIFGESFGYFFMKNFLFENLDDKESRIEFIDFSEVQRALEQAPLLQETLLEKEFRYGDLDDQEQEVLYNVFRDTYVKATGAAFDKDGFDWRASGWTFFGEPPKGASNEASVGGIAVRKQISNNMYKLVASFGNFRGVLKGFAELKQKANGASVWGIVDETIKKLIIKHDKDFVAPPGIVVKAMEAGVKKLSNGEVKSVNLDGSMQVSTPAGIMKKYFVANKDYIRWLLDSISDPANASRLPVPQAVLTPLIGIIQKLL
jgi:hypothetical protein